MASTYTTNAGIELIGTGEQSGTWGDTTNINLQIIDRLTSGVGAISLSGTTHTLTTSDGVLSDGQYAMLLFGGSPTDTNLVTIAPNDQQKIYFVKNESGENVVLAQGSGDTVTVANGNGAIVYANGAGASASVYDLTTSFPIAGALLAANNLSDVPNKSLARINMGLGIGIAVQAYDAKLQGISNATPTDGAFLVGDGSAFVAEESATALQSLGVTATADELNRLDIAAAGTSESNKAVTADANGNVKLSEELQAKSYIETGVALIGTTVTVDCHLANVFVLTTAGNTTFTFNYDDIGLTTSEVYAFTLMVTGGADYTLDWPENVYWPDGLAPDGPASGETDIFVFVTVDGGTNWFGTQAGNAFS